MKVYCPYCKKNVDYRIEQRNVNMFRGIEVNTYENVAICKICDKELYINNIEKENNERIYNIYRNKTDIINPQDIINFREKYNISQRELTSILDFGKMTINRYEKGCLPSKSQSDYIKLLISNKDDFIKKVEQAYKNNRIGKKTYAKILLNNNEYKTIQKDIQNLYRKNIKQILDRKPDIFNGYRHLNLDKVEDIISYIASKVKNLTITSLNKYLWYIDMLSFNERSISITGLTYEHEKFGPTIFNQEYEEISLLTSKYKREIYENEYGSTIKIISNNNFDLSQFEEIEINIIDTIIKLLKNKKVTEISEMSHSEKAWSKTKRYEKISFKYAMDLNIINN